MAEVQSCGCKAWYFNDDGSSRSAPHQYNPARPVSAEELERLGVLHAFMEGKDQDPKLTTLREQRGYQCFDVVNLNHNLPVEKAEIFYEEHLHEDEEIRLCIEGSGYFDVRAKGDSEWIRIECGPGDLLIVPAGIYHRFTMDENQYMKTMRIFTTEPRWVPHNRSSPATEELTSRQDYVRTIAPEEGPTSYRDVFKAQIKRAHEWVAEQQQQQAQPQQ